MGSLSRSLARALAPTYCTSSQTLTPALALTHRSLSRAPTLAVTVSTPRLTITALAQPNPQLLLELTGAA